MVINADTLMPTEKHLKKQYKYYNPTPVYNQTIHRPLDIASLWRAPRTVIVNPKYFQYSRSRIDAGYSFFSKTSILTAKMNNKSITPQAINTWRDYVLQHIVDNLEANKDNILEQFECEDTHCLTRQEIEQNGLMDFDISVTLHRDKKQSFGLGLGFFKANLLR